MTRASEQVGRSGEYLACSVLAQISDTVTLVPHGAEADIICGFENQLYKVQVKTATSESVSYTHLTLPTIVDV